MIMTKFEPVAFVQSDPDGHLHLTEITKTEACQNLDQWDKQVGWKAVPLHTEDQLSEAYEAGKRDASEDLEQAAFEKWLYDKCPSGDVESVQSQWLKSYEYEEFAGKLEQAAQIEGLNEQVAELERAKEYKYVEQVLRPIKILIALAQSAETLAENSEETENSSGKIALGMPSDFETLSENLDLLDELPDDKPGYTLSGAAKAAWALRDLLGENYD